MGAKAAAEAKRAETIVALNMVKLNYVTVYLSSEKLHDGSDGLPLSDHGSLFEDELRKSIVGNTVDGT